MRWERTSEALVLRSTGCWNGKRRKLVQEPNSGTQEVTLSIVDVIPQKFFARTPSLKRRNTSRTGQQVTVPQIPTKPLRKSSGADTNVINRGRTDDRIENIPKRPRSPKSRNPSKSKPIRDVNTPSAIPTSGIPSWLPDRLRTQNIAIVSMTQAKKLDKETESYLSQVFPAARYFVVRTETLKRDLELDKFPKIIGPGKWGIVAIHAYTPNPGTLELARSEEEYLLYAVREGFGQTRPDGDQSCKTSVDK